MSGPSTTRIPNAQTAPQPSLTQGGLNTLSGIFGGQGSYGALGQQGGSQGYSANQASPLGTAYGNLQGMFGSPLSPNISNTLTQFATGPNPAQGVVAAAQPLMQSSLHYAQDQGPRFSSGNDLLQSQVLNNYNQFVQQTLQQGQQQQAQAALGLGQLQANTYNPLLQQALGTYLQAGGLTTPAVLQQQPSAGQQLLGLLGLGGGAALGGGFNPLSSLAGLFGGQSAGQQALAPGGSAGVPNQDTINALLAAFGLPSQ